MSHKFYIGLDSEKKAVETTDHVLLLGGIGTSKTYAMQHNLIENDNVNVLVVDVLGELYINTAKLKQAQGYEVVNVNLLESIELNQIKRVNGQEKIAIYLTAHTKEKGMEDKQKDAEKMAINLDHVLQVLMAEQRQPLRIFIDHSSPLLYIPTLPQFLSIAAKFQCQVIMSLLSTHDLLHYQLNERVHLQSQIHTVVLMGSVDVQSVDMIGLVRGQNIDVRDLSDWKLPGSHSQAIVCQREPQKAFTAQCVTKEYGVLSA